MAEYLEGIPGRKNLLWLSSSFPIPVTPTMAAGTSGTARAGSAPQWYSVGAQGGPQILDLTELESEHIRQTYSALMRAQIGPLPDRRFRCDRGNRQVRQDGYDRERHGRACVLQRQTARIF